MGGFELAALSFVAYVVLVPLVLRLLPGRSPALLAVGSAPIVFCVAMLLVAGSGQRVQFWPYSAAYWFATGSFLMVFGALYKSVSLRLLGYLLDQPGRSMNYDEVMRKYVEDETFARRIVVMQEAGLALSIPGGYTLTERGRTLALALRGLHGWFRIERSG
jgi:hypothetical protein